MASQESQAKFHLFHSFIRLSIQQLYFKYSEPETADTSVNKQTKFCPQETYI